MSLRDVLKSLTARRSTERICENCGGVISDDGEIQERLRALEKWAESELHRTEEGAQLVDAFYEALATWIEDETPSPETRSIPEGKDRPVQRIPPRSLAVR